MLGGESPCVRLQPRNSLCCGIEVYSGSNTSSGDTAPPVEPQESMWGALRGPERALSPQGLRPLVAQSLEAACVPGNGQPPAAGSGVAQTAPAHCGEGGIQQGAAARGPGPFHPPQSPSRGCWRSSHWSWKKNFEIARNLRAGCSTAGSLNLVTVGVLRPRKLPSPANQASFLPLEASLPAHHRLPQAGGTQASVLRPLRVPGLSPSRA